MQWHGHFFRFRLIKDFDRELKDEESKNPPEVNRQLNDKKQSMVGQFYLLLCGFVVKIVS